MNELAYFGGEKVLNEGDYSIWPSPCQEDLCALKKVVDGVKYHRVNNPIVVEFEEEIKRWTGFSGGRAVGTGTAAIHIGMEYYAQMHQKVLTSPINWPGAVAPIYLAGMKPVYVDVNLEDACMKDSAALDELGKGNASMCLATHLFGNVAYLPKTRSYVACRDNLCMFDDCSQGLGISRILSEGSESLYTNAVAFSGNGAKHLASGELGVLLSDDGDLITYVDYVSLSSSSRNGERVFSPFTRGFNYRPNVFSCSIATSRLATMTQQLRRRRENARTLYEKIRDLEGLKPLFGIMDDNACMYSAPFYIEMKSLGLPEQGVYRDFIVELLHAEGLPVSVWLSRPVWEYLDYEKPDCSIEDFTNAKRLLESMFCITEIAPPNSLETMQKYALAFRKVWSFVKANTDFVIAQVTRTD